MKEFEENWFLMGGDIKYILFIVIIILAINHFIP